MSTTKAKMFKVIARIVSDSSAATDVDTTHEQGLQEHFGVVSRDVCG